MGGGRGRGRRDDPQARCRAGGALFLQAACARSSSGPQVLIVDVEVERRRTSLRVLDDRIVAIGPELAPQCGETVVRGAGRALLPALNDHHVHLFSTAAALESLSCAPPLDEIGMMRRLSDAAAAGGASWVRGVGYHDSVAGDIDRDFLDACSRDTPVRIQHRTGRLWIFNSAGLDRLLEGHEGDDPLERCGNRLTGRLFDNDAWLRSRTNAQRPDLRRLSVALARRGVTGVTDASHLNDASTCRALEADRRSGALIQDVLVFGIPALDAAQAVDGVRIGAVKFHLHDDAPPDIDWFSGAIEQAHAAGRPVAVHCVTVADLVVTLHCLETAGADARDRIEHAALVPGDLIAWIARLGVTVVTQPHFIAERGDSYLRDLERDEIAGLYRVRSLQEAGVPVAVGTDCPYGQPDPWASMQAAVDRCTRGGDIVGACERISPEAALACFTGALDAPGAGGRQLAPGQLADMCLIDRDWSRAREALGQVRVDMTWKRGTLVWDRRRAALDYRSDAIVVS